MLFQAVDNSGVNGERIAIILGLITLLLALAAFASCRTCLSWLNRAGIKNLPKSKAYQSFYKYHAVIWWLFGVSLISHVFMAMGHTGLPEAGDPDAGSHWLVIIPGFFGALFSFSIFSSCRIFPRLVSMASSSLILNNLAYRLFFKYHTYFWLALGLLIAAHFTAGYRHAGVWPQ
jgi:hypothetical protein